MSTSIVNRTGEIQRTVSEGGENTCPVCHDPILMFAIGPCDHPICHKCSTRMRVLCEKNDCPICRGATPQVAYVYHRQLFKDINLRNCIPNRKYKIFFEDEEMEDSYLELLEYKCRICRNRGPDKTFALLQTHMRREHQLFACDLCITFLKIFPYERKFYNRKNLATHRRIGDSDDKSYKGHPLCEFCDSRYYDKDELMKHLRKDHYFCHFCDQQGSNAYYDQYPDLMNHFSESHYLCTDEECANPSTRFTHAFVSEIDLKAHKAAVHNKNFTKAQSREARTLEVEFQLPPRRQGRGGDNYLDGRSAQRPRGGDRHSKRRDHNQEDLNLHRALEASRESFASETAEARPPVAERVPDPVHDFPSLNGGVAPTSTASPATATQAVRSPEEDFPSLSSTRGNGVSTKQLTSAPSKAYSLVMNPPAVQTRPASVAVINEFRPVPLGSLPSAPKERLSGAQMVPPGKREDDYPALGRGASRSVSSGKGSWLAKSSTANGTASAVAVSKTLAISKVPSRSVSTTKAVPFKKPISDENEFPSLNGRGRVTPSGGGNPFTERSTVRNGPSKKQVTPRSEKVDDDSFELPDSYYTSKEDPTASSNISLIDSIPEPVLRTSSKVVPTSSAKDFPGLPTREKKPLEATNDKKKKSNKKTRDKLNGPEKNPAEEANASLGEIALALMQPGARSENKKSVQNSTKTKPKKPTDWFDSPPKEFTEKSTPMQQQEQQKKSLPMQRQEQQQERPSFKPPEPEVNNTEDSFPSLHTMSTSVQLQLQQKPQRPPGFSDVTPSHQAPPTSTSVAAPPPGFSTAPKANDLNAISSVLTSSPSVPAPPPGFNASAVIYIQPPEFKKRNTQLIADIREALETVEDGFSNFRVLSGQFRQGVMEASDYHCSIRALMGVEDFTNIFPELLALLPDVNKQRQLWEVHQASAGASAAGKNKRGMSMVMSMSGSTKGFRLTQCSTCGQVVLTRDLQHHNLEHGVGLAGNNDFPTLNGVGSDEDDTKKAASNSGASALKVNGAWIKAK